MHKMTGIITNTLFFSFCHEYTYRPIPWIRKVERYWVVEVMLFISPV